MEHKADAVYARWQRPHASAGMSDLQVVCAWCQHHIVWHQVPPPLPFSISYSICVRCYTDVAREVTPLSAEVTSPGLRAV